MIPPLICCAAVFALASAALIAAAVLGRRGTALAAAIWCAGTYAATAVTVIAGAVHA